MAIIFETPEDIKRTQLKNRISREQNTENLMERLAASGMTITLVSNYGFSKNPLINKIASFIGLAATAIGVLGVFNYGLKERKIIKELRSLGPQEIVLPQVIPENERPPEITEGWRKSEHTYRIANERKATISEAEVTR